MPDTNTMQNQDGGIASRAVCLLLEFRKPGYRRKVSTEVIDLKAQGAEAQQTFGPDVEGAGKEKDKSMLNLTKRLFESDDYDSIVKLDNQIHTWLYQRTLPSPFNRDGVYMIPLVSIVKTVEQLWSYLGKRKDLVKAFVAKWDQIKLEAKVKLEPLGLYDPAQYASVEIIEAAFQMSWQVLGFGAPGSLESVSKELMKSEQKKAAQSWANATDQAQSMMWEGFSKLVEHMVELADPEKKFKDSRVENIREFFKTFPDLNSVINDTELRKLVSRASKLLSGIDADQLRKSSVIRGKVAEGFEQIKKAISASQVQKPKRAIQMQDEETVNA
jgi:hypothetical protein